MRCRLALVALLAGCATARPVVLADLTPDLLCYVQAHSPLESEKANVTAELQQRGRVCTLEDITKGQVAYAHWLQIRQAQAQQDAASRRAFGDALIGIGAAAVITTPPPPQPVNCTTVYIGQRAETTCR
jgi:hypothetical protein